LVVMSKLEQAPGDLDHIRAFVNTFERDDDTDELTSPAELVRWLEARGLTPPHTRATNGDLSRARELREALRAALLGNTAGSPVPADAAGVFDSVARRAKVQLRFAPPGRPTLEAAARGVDGALGRLLAIMHAAVADGTWQRLKACRDESCEWAFYDHTKNRSGAWCSMEVCGNRAKARAYRERRSSRQA
jgi:predicted RNA-binding Zn ribbon-like protein